MLNQCDRQSQSLEPRRHKSVWTVPTAGATPGLLAAHRAQYDAFSRLGLRYRLSEGRRGSRSSARRPATYRGEGRARLEPARRPKPRGCCTDRRSMPAALPRQSAHWPREVAGARAVGKGPGSSPSPDPPRILRKYPNPGPSQTTTATPQQRPLAGAGPGRALAGRVVAARSSTVRCSARGGLLMKTASCPPFFASCGLPFAPPRLFKIGQILHEAVQPTPLHCVPLRRTYPPTLHRGILAALRGRGAASRGQAEALPWPATGCHPGRAGSWFPPLHIGQICRDGAARPVGGAAGRSKRGCRS